MLESGVVAVTPDDQLVVSNSHHGVYACSQPPMHCLCLRSHALGSGRHTQATVDLFSEPYSPFLT